MHGLIVLIAEEAVVRRVLVCLCLSSIFRLLEICPDLE